MGGVTLLKEVSLGVHVEISKATCHSQSGLFASCLQSEMRSFMAVLATYCLLPPLHHHETILLLEL